MGEKTLRIGTGVDDLVVSRAGHLALRLNPQDWHREANLIEGASPCEAEEPRTEKLLQSIATVLINSRGLSEASVQKASRPCLKNVAQLPHHDEHPRHCFVCSVPSDQCCVACSHPVCHDCSHKTLCTRCVFNVDDKNSCSNASSSLVESDCVLAEVNIVEEEQNMWRRTKKGTKFQLDAGRRSALLLSSQQVKPQIVAESLITSTVKDALSRTPRETFPATRVRVRP